MHGLARNSDPGTSHDAGKALSHRAIEGIHNKIIEAMSRSHDGMILDEIIDETRILGWTVSPRMVELERRGKVFRKVIGKTAKGYRRYESRLGSRGRKQQLWFIKRVS